MQIDRSRLREIGTWILVICVLISTTLVVRREFVLSPGASATKEVRAKWKRVEADGWRDALNVGIRHGSANAPVQIVEFTDYQCPYCARFQAIGEAVRNKYPDQVAFTFVPFPLYYHEYAETAERIAQCAHRQGRFVPMRSLLFEKQQDYGSIQWIDLAKQVEIENLNQFDACVNETEPLERVEQGKELADKIGVRGTPTVIVNGWMMPLAPSLEDLEKIIENVVDGRPLGTGIEEFFST